MREVPLTRLGSQINAGVFGLDVLAGGFPAGTSILAETETGSEAEVFAQQFAYAGLKNGEAVLYVSFVRSPTKIVESFENLGWNIHNYLLNGQLTFIALSSLVSKGAPAITFQSASDIDLINHILSRAIEEKKQDFTHIRIVFDSISDWISYASLVEVCQYLTKLNSWIKDQESSILLMVNPKAVDTLTLERLRSISDCIIRFYAGTLKDGILTPQFQILKNVASLVESGSKIMYDYFVMAPRGISLYAEGLRRASILTATADCDLMGSDVIILAHSAIQKFYKEYYRRPHVDSNGISYALSEMGIHHVVVGEQEITGVPSLSRKNRILFLSDQFFMDEPCWKQIRDFTEFGITIFADFGVGLLQPPIDYVRPWKNLTFRPDIFGCKYSSEIGVLKRGSVLEQFKVVEDHPAIAGIRTGDETGITLAQPVEVTEGRVLLRFQGSNGEDGGPALIYNEYGKGATFYFPGNMGNALFHKRKGSENLKKIIQNAIDYALKRQVPEN